MWWQKKRKLLKGVGIFIAYLLGMLLVAGIIVGIVGGYVGGWQWTGVNNALGPVLKPNQQYWPAKTLWDWMQLLLVPIILAIGGYWLNKIQRKREEKSTQQRDNTAQNIAQDNQYESVLQGYFEKMSELIIMHHLRKPERDDAQERDDVREIAKMRTLTGLPHLGRKRKRNVLQFLHQSKFLLRGNKAIIDLQSADLREADLIKINLSEADLRNVDLSKATLCKADLRKVDLSEAKLPNVDLRQADLSEGKLTHADLTEADLTGANLREAHPNDATLNGAILTGADLYRADLVASELIGARLTGADLSEADLTGTDLENADLTRANLTRAKLEGAYLMRANLEKANLGGANLNDANLEKANLRGVNLNDANLDGTNLYQADLTDITSNKKISWPHKPSLKFHFRKAGIRQGSFSSTLPAFVDFSIDPARQANATLKKNESSLIRYSTGHIELGRGKQVVIEFDLQKDDLKKTMITIEGLVSRDRSHVGYSPISLRLNDHEDFLSNYTIPGGGYSPKSKSFPTRREQLTRGQNTLTLTVSPKAETNFWLYRLEISRRINGTEELCCE